jgi:hypothetical protein
MKTPSNKKLEKFKFNGAFSKDDNNSDKYAISTISTIQNDKYNLIKVGLSSK